MAESALQQLEHLNQQIANLRSEHRYKEAIALAQHLRSLARTTRGKDHLDYVLCLNDLADLYEAVNNYDAAVPIRHEALTIRRHVLGTSHPEVAASINSLAQLYCEMGRYSDAQPLYQEAMKIDRAAFGDDHPTYAADLNNLGLLYYHMHNFAAAKPLYQQALTIRRKVFGEQHPDVADSLHNFAMLYKEIGDYRSAEPLFQQAVKIDRSILERDDAQAATHLHNFGTLYRTLGNYGKAETLLTQALETRLQVLGEQHLDVAESRNTLAGLYREQGNFSAAKSLYEQVIEVSSRKLGPDHPHVATALNNLAELYRQLGDFESAEPLYRQALQIRQKVFGKSHLEVAGSLNNLGMLYYQKHDYVESERFYEQALEMKREVGGAKHPAVAITLSNLGLLYYSKGCELLAPEDFATAERHFQEVLEIDRQAIGEKHPGYATALNNLALIHDARGEYAASEQFYRQAADIYRSTLGDAHPDLADALNNLALLYIATQREDEGLQLFKQVAAIDDKIIQQAFSIGSERQRMEYLATVQDHVHQFLAQVVRVGLNSANFVRLGMQIVLQRKALTAEALAVQRDAVLKGRYPALEPKLRELTNLRIQITQQLLAHPASEDRDAHTQLLDEWNRQKERLEAELASQIREINLEQQLQNVNWQAVAQALPPASALVEFMRFDDFDAGAVAAQGDSYWQPARYLAFILRSDTPEDVQLIDLGEAEPIDQLIASFRNLITNETKAFGQRVMLTPATAADVETTTNSADKQKAVQAIPQPPGVMRDLREDTARHEEHRLYEVGKTLRTALWDPLISALSGSAHILLAPDGDLTRLPVEVLPLEDQRWVIDMYQLSYLSVGRDLLRFHMQPESQPGESLVIADPNYSLGAVKGAATKLFRRLSGTRLEGQRIAAMLGVKPLLGNAVLKPQIRSYRSPHILHLATHGFFLADEPDSPDTSATRSGLVQLLKDRLAGSANPLLRSGLALAGVNAWLLRGEMLPKTEDGLLFAEDVTGLDLLDTELVVLSACDTGLGDIHPGEGVFGLRRAFVLAGVKTLVMSLWKVPDQQTQELMIDFYTRLLRGVPRAAALRGAQLALKARYPHPRLWGAFIKNWHGYRLL